MNFLSEGLFIDAYWIRELIYIESTLPNKTWLKSNTTEREVVDHYLKDSIQNKTDKQEEDDDEKEDEFLMNYPYGIELRKLLDILHKLCTQTKQVLDHEIDLERMLKQLLTIRKTRDSMGSDLIVKSE